MILGPEDKPSVLLLESLVIQHWALTSPNTTPPMCHVYARHMHSAIAPGVRMHSNAKPGKGHKDYGVLKTIDCSGFQVKDFFGNACTAPPPKSTSLQRELIGLRIEPMRVAHT